MKPSEFYRQLRPENFSDSTLNDSLIFPKAIAEYHLSKVSEDQKEHQFEILARRLAEKCICPNLIPATWPAWWWDWKTDTETHPVSDELSIRRFNPIDRNTNQKRAFAVSAKQDRKSKLLWDIKKIIWTNRWYTQIFFITSVKISSKKRKDTEDAYKKEFNIGITILDGNWIIETVYDKNYLNIFIETLWLEWSLIESTRIDWSRDYERRTELEEVEKNILNTDRYSVNDYQLWEECIKAIVLSRKLELPKEEVIWKIERTNKIVTQIWDIPLLIKSHYQSAWTYIMYLDEYWFFFDEYKIFKEYVKQLLDIDWIEKRKTLLTLCFPLEREINFQEYWFEFNNELEELTKILNQISENNTRPTASLIAKTHLLFLQLQKKLFNEEDIDPDVFKQLGDIIDIAKSHLWFPMKMVIDMIKVIGELPFDSEEIDILFDKIAELVGQREWEISSANIFLDRWIEKLKKTKYNQAISWFGKCIVKLAKEESKRDLITALWLVWSAYKWIWLYRAAHTSFIQAFVFAAEWLKDSKSGKVCLCLLKELIYNELLALGRVPNILQYWLIYRWIFFKYSLYLDDAQHLEKFGKEIDEFLCCRLIWYDLNLNDLSYLPDVLDQLDLLLSNLSVLYLIWHTNEFIDSWTFTTIDDLDVYYSKIGSQPFLWQTVYPTNLILSDTIFYSKVIWLQINFNICCLYTHIPIVETFLSFIEIFFATSIWDIVPFKEYINISLEINDISDDCLKITSIDYYNYILTLNPNLESSNFIKDNLLKVIIQLLLENFRSKNDIDLYLRKVFEEEIIMERLWLTTLNPVLKNNFFWTDWDYDYQKIIEQFNANKYEILRKDFYVQRIQEQSFMDKWEHQNINVRSMINMELWDNAAWDWVWYFFCQDKVYLWLMFKNIDFWTKIFDERIDRLWGVCDRKKVLRISIIQWVDELNPHHYIVQITSNITDQWDWKYVVPARYNTMTPNDDYNLSLFISRYNFLKEFYLAPAFINNLTWEIQPQIDKAIFLQDIVLKNKNEIWKNDLEFICLNKDSIE